MSLDQEMRFGSSDYHRGFNNLLGFGGFQGSSYENDNIRQNLNQLLNGGSDPSKFCNETYDSPFSNAVTLQSLLKETQSSEYGSLSSFSNSGFSYNSPNYSSPLTPSLGQNSLSSSQTPYSNYSPFLEPNSLYSNHDQLGLSNLANLASSCISPSYSKPLPSPSPQETSILGLSDISARLEASLSLSSSNPNPLPSSLPSDTSMSSRSRNSTPLSWNPLGQLSATPLSSVSPSPVMINKMGDYSSHHDFNDRRTHYQEEEKEIFLKSKPTKNPKTPKKGPVTRSRNRSAKMTSPVLTSEISSSASIRGIQALGSGSSSSSASGSSWAGVVRTSASTSRLPSLAASPPPQTFLTAAQVESPCVDDESGCPAVTREQNTAALLGLDFHRGPKVDPRWPVAQQVFLGPIPMTISWDEIRNVFYTKVSRRELLHFYVQSKPVNEVVYGQVVFDKPSLANKMVKDGPVKVRGIAINLTLMRDKAKAEKKK